MRKISRSESDTRAASDEVCVSGKKTHNLMTSLLFVLFLSSFPELVVLGNILATDAGSAPPSR